MDETQAQSRNAPRKKKKKRVTAGGVLLGILKVLGTLLVIGILTTALFYRTFMRYVETTLEPEVEVNLSAYTLKLSSVVYYQDKDSGRWLELQKLHGSEHRILVNFEDLPDYVWQALVAIEDQRFFEHHGVDWKSTAGQVFNMLTGGDVRGASTITQQLVKNMTGNNEVTIRRKVLEIFQALRLAENYSRDQILETYLNKVYFGDGAYGIGAAADKYFGKTVGELTVAEAADIIGITQNPYMYDPSRGEDFRKWNKDRQETVLMKMNELGYLTDSQYKAALAEKLVYVWDADYVASETDGAEPEEAASSGSLYSYFVEQVFNDVVDAFMDMGYNERTAQDMIYTGGYRIFCTVDPNIQDLVEKVYADRSNFNYPSAKGQQLQSGMTVIDNSSGNIVAIAGRVGERGGAFEWSYAANRRPCGSAIKPLSVYSPAIDAGIVTAASVIDDYPVRTLNGSIWPVNAYSGYRGLTTIQDALRVSSNTCAVRVVEKLGLSNSYAWMTEKLGFTKLESADIDSGPLALGGLTYGVTTIEMAAAYSAFANNGVYTTPRTFLEVQDNNYNVIIDNRQDSWVAMKETTVYTMNELLKNVVRSGGTGVSAAFSGMTMAGKTGTTNSKYDRYFVGYTPYYTTAVWCGYDRQERIDTNDNPSALAWKKVMEPIHRGLEDRDFPTTSEGMTRVTVCNKTGLLAGSGCGSTRSVLVAQGMGPVVTCDAHVGVDFCTESELPAGEYCPEETRTTVWAVDLSAPNTEQGFGYHRELLWRGLTQAQYATYAAQIEDGTRDSMPDGMPVYANDSGAVLSDLRTMGVCTVHTTAPVPDEGPDDPDALADSGNPLAPPEDGQSGEDGGGTPTIPVEEPPIDLGGQNGGGRGSGSGAAQPEAKSEETGDGEFLDWLLGANGW